MEDNEMGNSQDSMQNENANRGAGEKRSPEEVKENVKQTVAKGVAAVAGALKGFTEEAEKNKLAQSTKHAIQKAGETTRQVAGTATQEFQKTKEHVKGQAGGTGSPGTGSSTSSVGSSGVTGDSGPQMGMGGSELGAASTVDRADVNDMPDLRKTELAKTDEQLEEE
jgi:type II secretory pathway pseudopilin PulG